MKTRATIVVLLLIAALSAAAYTQRAEIAVGIFTRTAEKRMAEKPLTDLPDGLHVGLCGSGSPIPDVRRSAPCTVVLAGKRVFIFDAGANASRGIARMGINAGDIEAIHLTHFHSDHMDGLGELMLMSWVAGVRSTPVPVRGPEGVETIVSGLMQAYAQDKQYRVAHHGEKRVPPGGFGGTAQPFSIVGGPFGTKLIVDEPELKILAFGVSHEPVHPAVGYRITYKDRSVVISGDTSKSLSVEREAKGADLLVHEVLSKKLVGILEDSARKAGREDIAKIFHDIPEYHTWPEQVAEIARSANVGAVLLTHVVPSLPPVPGAEAAFLGDARDIYSGKLVLGRDGDFVSLPAGSKQIQFSNRW